MLRLTPFGRNIYAIWGNRDAALLGDIRVARIETFRLRLAGMFAALAGILYASRMDSGQPAVGDGWLMGAITAAILGGTSLKGGQGTIVGTVFGTLLIAGTRCRRSDRARCHSNGSLAAPRVKVSA